MKFIKRGGGGGLSQKDIFVTRATPSSFHRANHYDAIISFSGLCEGSCPALTIDKSFFHPDDPNKGRKRAKIMFVTDLNIERIKDMPNKKERVSNSLKEERVENTTYGIPLIRAERPWIIFIDERTEQEKNFAEEEERNRTEREKQAAKDDLERAKEKSTVVEKEKLLRTPVKNVRHTVHFSPEPNSDPYDVDYQIADTSFESPEKEETNDLIKNIAKQKRSPAERFSKRKYSDFDDKVNAKRRRASGPNEEEMSFRAIRGELPPTDRQAAMAEKQMNFSKERSYLKQMERKTREGSIDDEEGRRSTTPKANRLGLIGYGLLNERDKSKSTPGENKLRQPQHGPTTQELKKRKNVEALKRLQRQDLEENRTSGTYVQCCNQKCAKWRLVTEYTEPEQVSLLISIPALQPFPQGA